MTGSLIMIVLIFTGIVFILIAAIGIIRMPDVYTRMSAAAKAVTFGTGFILLGVVVHFNDTWILLKIAGIFIFLLFSISVATNVIGLAAWEDNTDISDLTFLNELKKEEKDDVEL